MYNYDDMVKAILEERERIIALLENWEHYWGQSTVLVSDWWKVDYVWNLVKLVREYTPTPSDVAMAREQQEDEMLMNSLDTSGQRIRDEEEEIEKEATLRSAADYESEGYGKIDDHTSVWGRMGGPDCRIVPARAPVNLVCSK